MTVVLPLVEALPSGTQSADVFERLATLPHVVFFDSARHDTPLGRYSFVAADPWQYEAFRADDRDTLDRVAALMAPWSSERRRDLPPFQGGLAGLFSYDLGRQFERLASPRHDEFEAPIAAVGLYDVLVAFDHLTEQAWLISQGYPEREPLARQQRAANRLDQFRALIEAPPRAPWRSKAVRPNVSASQLAAQFPVGNVPGLTSNFSRSAYLAAIERAIEYIHAGDIFQVNLAQRLLYPAQDDSLALYLRLRERNPAPFAGYFDLGEFQIVSASPERFVSITDGQVEARPIKGTRRRIARPEADLFRGDELLQSEKDRAENVMIVDLLRNDLGRVCRRESIRVTQLCQLELYEYVQHLVSVVQGQLNTDKTAVDLLRVAFPGGSITGAPKVRAMEIVAELEPTARGPYCGCLAYWGLDGSFDASILIRTITAGRGWWQAPVGGGIVAPSIPEQEYDETWHKAEGLLRALH